MAAEWPLKHAAEAAELGLSWPTGILLSGPPGCGKTLLVRSVAAQCGASVHEVAAASIYSSFAGVQIKVACQSAGCWCYCRLVVRPLRRM